MRTPSSRSILAALLAVVSLASLTPKSARAEGPSGVQSGGTWVGAAAAPATLPEGSTAVWGYGGVPELAAGFRQGIGPVELEAKARFDYFQLSIAGEGGVRLRMGERRGFQVGPGFALGLVADSGSRHLDDTNVPQSALRFLPSVVLSRALFETFAVVGTVEAPIDFGLGGAVGNTRFAPVALAGGELYLGDGIYGLLQAGGGFEYARENLGTSRVRGIGQVRLGLGLRIF